MGWEFSAHLRAFLVVPVVPPSCCLRLAPLPFPLLPAAIPPLKRRKITFNELWQKHHVDTEIPWGLTLPTCICATPTGGFPSQEHTGFHSGSEWMRWVSHSPEHWVPAVRSNEPGLHFQPSFLSELQLPVHVLRMWHKCIFTHSGSRHPQLTTTIITKLFFPTKSIQTSIKREHPHCKEMFSCLNCTWYIPWTQ